MLHKYCAKTLLLFFSPPSQLSTQKSRPFFLGSCSGYVYLIWDGRFIHDFIGTYTWQEGDSGANIIIKQMYAEYTRQRYLVISGECWCGNERGIFESKMSVLGYEPYYDSVTGFGYLEFVDDRNQSLEAYKTDDDGILIRQIGTIEDGNYNKVAKASFNGTYYAGLTDRAQTVIDEMPVSGDDYRYKLVAQYGNFTMSDLGFNDNDLNFYWEEGNNEDATGADIFIYYDENWCSDSTYNVPLAFLPGAKFL